ncbi:MAG TPA: chlorite dismutase family protein [Candidatus Binatia bacterium]|nr:chlorite dismutase family protein [Candidatus Binatia bacterium]
MSHANPGSRPSAPARAAGCAGEAGWPVLHLFQRVDRERWRHLSAGERAEGAREFGDLLGRLQGEEGMQLIASGVIGKADLGVMAVHPDLARVQRLTQELAATALGSCLVPVYSFLSISEKSEYISTPGDQARKLIDDEGLAPESPEFQQQLAGFTRRMAAYADARLHPQLPGSEYPVLCFYPMSKARGEARNWYRLPFGERKRLMGSHADAGRRFADRVTQLITSATGLDDWEWGVTLFTRDLKAIRDIVYEMRYDEGSALYGQFGPFYVSVRFQPSDVRDALAL